MCPDSDVKLQRRSELSVWDCGERERDATPARPGAVGHDRDGESSQEKHELSGGASTTDWAKQKLWGKSKGACKSGVYRKARKARLRNGFFFVDLCFLFSLSSLPPSLSIENLVPGTGKAARLVALSQADPQLPMAGLVSPSGPCVVRTQKNFAMKFY